MLVGQKNKAIYIKKLTETVVVCVSSFRPRGCFRGGGGGLGVGGGLYGDASGREWEVEVGTNSTRAQDTDAS